jgi:glycosyltransferase involved in cell wall biosynthesis
MQVAGAEVLVAETIRRLGGRIVPVVFCLDVVGELGCQLQAEGVEVVALGRRPGVDWRIGRRLAAELRARHIEVLHAHQYTPFFYAALARLFGSGGARLIFTEHGRHFPDVVSRRRRLANRLIFSRLVDDVNAVCAFSAASLRRVEGFAGRSINVIENGIEMERYGRVADRTALRRRLGLDPARRYIANVARCHPVKDQATLLRAFRRVATARADVDLLLVGDGPLRADLERLAGELTLGPRVKFLGVRSDVSEILRSIDLFVLTSTSEAAPITLLEAMASRLPVVATAVGGNPEIVRDRIEGLLVPPRDEAAIADALLELLDNPARAASFGSAGEQRVSEHYRLARTIERYFALYVNLAAPPVPRVATA